VPGTIEAEDFDLGGYSDTTAGNEGTAYRTDVDVDIKAVGDGFALGWMTAGEWLEYTINVAVEGDYTVTLHAGAVEAGRTVELSSCGAKLGGTIAIPQVGEWGQFSDTAGMTIHLTPGLQVIRLTVGALDYLDLDSITLESGAAAGTGGAGTGGAGTGGALHKFVGNITTGWNGAMDTDDRVFKTYWDQVTPENAGKWGSVQATATSGFNWATLDAIYDYSKKNGIIFKQHTFVWGAQQPTGNITEANVKTWIQTFCQRYPETKLIDVVNEPPPHTEPSYAGAIGGGTNGSWAWITNAFKWAREYCPNAILILNDYNNIEYGDQNQHFIDIVKTIQAAGAPIDAVGAQSHGLSGGVSTGTMKTLITKLHNDTGLPVYITEYDIDQANDTAQLDKFKEHFPFFMETEWVHGVTIWGWIYGKTWIPASGLIRDGQPRPAMTWLMDQLGRPAP
jgi:endo-1,4-beta-xylanase